MRFIVWDDHHDALMGIIGLQSPILSWAPRDKYLNLNYDKKDWWVNQSMNAQRVGAIPPYNKILGSRLIASLLASTDIRRAFADKYEQSLTRIKGRLIPNRLLFVTTTGAYGKTPIYDRLSYSGQKMSFFLGYTGGYGSFHVDDELYKRMIGYLRSIEVNTSRGYGTGPSRRLRLISTAMRKLGYRFGAGHGISRGLYLFTPARNLKSIIHESQEPDYLDFPMSVATEFWKDRWLSSRYPRKVRFDTKRIRSDTQKYVGALSNGEPHHRVRPVTQ